MKNKPILKRYIICGVETFATHVLGVGTALMRSDNIIEVWNIGKLVAISKLAEGQYIYMEDIKC